MKRKQKDNGKDGLEWCAGECSRLAQKRTWHWYFPKGRGRYVMKCSVCGNELEYRR